MPPACSTHRLKNDSADIFNHHVCDEDKEEVKEGEQEEEDKERERKRQKEEGKGGYTIRQKVTCDLWVQS